MSAVRARRFLSLFAGGLALALAFLSCAMPVNAATAHQDAVVGSPLSPIGDRAVADLRACLSSNNALDVFYLLDASGSLFKNPGSDPDFVRADLIANSLRQLSGLHEGLQLSYGLGFFGTEYHTAIDWRSVDPADIDSEADRLNAAIRNQGSLDWTDWLEGIAGAQSELAARKATTNGCQVLVWLTDGGINLIGYNAALDDAALNELCGEQVRPGGEPAPGGAFNELRQSGTVVFGVLLRAPGGSHEARDLEYSAYMKPLVEGEGDVSTGAITCGEHPIPESYVAGAYLEATSAGDLAQVFLSLGAVVSGGYPTPFDADGGFDVDPGISQFRIVTSTNDWKLAGPDGISIGPGAIDDGVTIEEAGGASAVRVDVDDSRVGHWTWTSSDPERDELYFYSGLQIKLDTPGTFLAGADNRLSGTITRTDDRDVPLDAYDFDLRLSIDTAGTVSPIDTGDVELDMDTGEFTFHYSALEASGVVTLEADIENLRSLPSHSVLADVSSRLDVTVTLPDQYPSVSPQPLRLSDLVGSSGEASGTWTIRAPRDGTEGAVCLPAGRTPTIVSDAVDRSSTWQWVIEGDLDGDGCVKIGGGTTELTVSARNDVAAYSDVSAALPVLYRSSSGDEIDGSLPISFASTRPLDLWAFWLTVILLMLAGALLPLGILYFVNWLTHKMTQGKELLRASMPIVLTGDGQLQTPDGVSLRAFEWGIDSIEFKGSHDSRKYVDGQLGTVKAKVPLFPLGRPWYEIAAPNGRLLFGPTASLPLRRRKLEARGLIASFSGDLGKAWGFVVGIDAARTRRAGEDVAGTFVTYVRNTEKDTSVMYARIAEILGGENLNTRIARAVALLVADRPVKPPFRSPWARKPKSLPAKPRPMDPIDDLPPDFQDVPSDGYDDLPSDSFDDVRSDGRITSTAPIGGDAQFNDLPSTTNSGNDDPDDNSYS
jgi:hypothetical protein